MIDFADVEALVGRKFPGGTLRIAGYEDWLMRDAVHAPVDAEFAHPVWAFLGAIAGAGVRWDEFFALAGASAADAPMIGEVDLEIHEPLRRDVDYEACGEITGAARKSGATLGIFDRITFRVELAVDARRVASSTQTILFPRKN